MTLVEAFVYPECEREETVIMPPKRSRPSLDEDPTIPVITISRPAPIGPAPAAGAVVGLPVSTPGGISAGGLSQALTTAIKCWDLLNSYEQLRAGQSLHSVMHYQVLMYIHLFLHVKDCQQDCKQKILKN